MTSPKLYSHLRNLFLLPSDRLLRQLSSSITVKADHVDLRYLKRRVESLSNEKICMLLIDEIYTAKRIEYSNGCFYGITENGEKTKTVLVFMLQSLQCKYRDVVKLVPTDLLTVSFLHKHFETVMEAIKSVQCQHTARVTVRLFIGARLRRIRCALMSKAAYFLATAT